MKRTLPVVLAAVALMAASCSTTEETTTTTTAPTTTTTAAAEPEAPPTSPSSVTFEGQDSDGSSIVVASVSLPAAGFIAVHADADGSPGAIIGHSELLPAGESTDVTVTLDEPLTASATLWPMVHIDIDGDGVYTFQPPDNAIDIPGVTADGNVAVIPVEITIG